jgi:hypothetical protein
MVTMLSIFFKEFTSKLEKDKCDIKGQPGIAWAFH